MNKLISRYGENNIQLDLIGSDVKKNAWLVEELSGVHNLKVTIIPAVQKNELDCLLTSYDLGIVIARMPDYDLGTKAYEYVALGLPIFDYFDERNAFKDFFSGCFDSDYDVFIAYEKAFAFHRITQSDLYREYLQKLLF